MTNICSECGALLDENESCQTIFEEFLALEFSDPAYGGVHFLTVACFMVQHGRYSDEALTWIEGQLRAYLDEGVPAEHIRRQAAKETSQTRRAWKVTRPAGAPPLPKIKWSLTIADVAAQYQDAESYAGLVKRWARSTLQEMKPSIDKPPDREMA